MQTPKRVRGQTTIHAAWQLKATSSMNELVFKSITARRNAAGTGVRAGQAQAVDQLMCKLNEARCVNDRKINA